ncbi:MAG: acyltransferase [Candidatus Obscuribacterales bacterium]|nr:acyltransferase [Candidatus Obscuribacterales bacterium]
MSIKTATRIDSLTALRFFAAALIVVFHAQGHFACLDHIGERIVFSQGITFFFVLSGFILTLVYPSFDNGKQITEYLVKRLARLWPLHISVFLMRFLMFPKVLLTFPGAAPKVVVLLCNIFLLHGWIPLFQFFFSYNAPSWTISTEFFFYLCLPFILPLFTRAKWLPALLAFGITLGSIILCNSVGLDEYSEQGLSMRGLLYINPLPRLFEFVIGMTTAICFRDYVSKLKINKVICSIVELSAVAFTLLLMWNTKPIAQFFGSLPAVGRAGIFWLEYSGVPLFAFSLLILALARRGGVVSWILSVPILVLLGDISYAIYLCHHPLLVYHGLYLSQYRSLTAVAVFVTVLLLLSHMLYTLVETPFRKFAVKTTQRFLDPDRAKPEEVPNSFATKQRFSFRPLGSGKTMLIASELAVLIGLVWISHPIPTSISDVKAQFFMHNDNQIQKPIPVGESLTCLGINTLDSEEPGIQIIWKATKETTLKNYVSLQLLNEYSVPIYQQVTVMAPREASVKQGEVFIQTIELPEFKLRNAKKFGLIVSKPNQEQLTFDGGKTDSDGKRLVVDLGTKISSQDKHHVEMY